MLLLVSWCAAGQRTITGRTVEAGGFAVEGASVSIDGSHVGTTSDEWGGFTLRIPKINVNDTLSVTHVSYGEARVPLATFKNGGNITLTQQAVVAAEVVVEGKPKRVTLEMRGDNTMGWAWSFRPELAEFGSFIRVESDFRVYSFRFKVLKDPEVPVIDAQLVVYRIDNPYMVGVMQQNIVIKRREPHFDNPEKLRRWLDFDYRKKPFPGPKEEDGFIRLDVTELMKHFDTGSGLSGILGSEQEDSGQQGSEQQQDSTKLTSMVLDERDTFPTLPEYDFTVEPAEELQLTRGIYFVALKFVASAENVNLMNRYPWVFPQFGAFNEPGLLRRGDSFEFEGSERNAGIMVRGYGE
jgi:hypothetical protein